MLRLFFLYICINSIISEQILTISVGEKKMMNIDIGPLPLIVKPSEDVNEDIEFQCNGNIRYDFYYTNNGIDVGDENPLPKIPAGTKAGTEIKFNCIIHNSIYNEIITLNIEEQFYKSMYVGENYQYNPMENIKWKADKNNDKIEFVPMFVVNPSFTTSKNLEKNDKIYLDITLMDDIISENEIMDGTFFLNKENGETKVNLISCTKIPKNTKKGNLKITCLVDEEAKNGNFTLKLKEGQKIGDIEPMVSGYIVFSQDGPNNEDFPTENEEEIETNLSNKENKAKNNIKLKPIIILVLLSLL